MNYVKEEIGSQDKILVDVRTNDEYNGKTLAPTEYSTEYVKWEDTSRCSKCTWKRVYEDAPSICSRVEETL